MYLGNLGIPDDSKREVYPNVIISPTLGGASDFVSRNPEAILKILPSVSLTVILPFLPSMSPTSRTSASASRKGLTFSMQDIEAARRPGWYGAAESRRIRPSPPWSIMVESKSEMHACCKGIDEWRDIWGSQFRKNPLFSNQSSLFEYSVVFSFLSQTSNILKCTRLDHVSFVRSTDTVSLNIPRSTHSSPSRTIPRGSELVNSEGAFKIRPLREISELRPSHIARTPSSFSLQSQPVKSR